MKLNSSPVGRPAVLRSMSSARTAAGSALIWRDVSLATPGVYTLEASDGKDDER